MSTTSTRPLPRPLRLVSTSTSTSTSTATAPSSPGAHGLRSAPIILDPDVRPAPRRQSSISYKTGAASPRGSSASTGSLKHDVRVQPAGDTEPAQRLPAVRDTEPATLAEKHADLLRFIAQKESRCLELRTQLAQHEADLLLLKRKWERIVSKGGPRPGQVDRSDVLDGIREGVQSGLGRVFAVLEPTPVSAPQPRTSLQQASSTTPVATSSTSTTPSNNSTARSKRSSVSMGSPRARSSLGSRSASSAGSLFDDVAVENQSSASSVSDSPVLKPDMDIAGSMSPRASQAVKRNSFTFAPVESEPPQPDDDPSAKRRRARPASVQVVRPPVTAISSPTLSPGSATLGRQVSAWVPELNRKWEELKSNETLSKQSRRASVLLNDVLAALVPPAPSPTLRHAPSHTVLDSAFFDPALAASIGAGSGSGSWAAPRSLLDDDEDESAGSVGEVLQPEVKTTAAAVRAAKPDDADEWNW